MLKIDTVVIRTAQLVTLGGPKRARIGPELCDLGIREGWALAVADGRICHVRPSWEIEEMIRPETEVIDATECTVLPGFVDAHTHPVFGGNRLEDFARRCSGATYSEIAAAGGGIQSTVKKTRAATEDELVAVGERHARIFLENGTTTIEAKSGYGLTAEVELRLLRAIRRLGLATPLRFLPTYLGAHAVPPESKHDPNLYLEEVLNTMGSLKGLAIWCDVFVEDGYFTPDQAVRLERKARSVGLGLRMHVDQFSDSGGAVLAARLKADTADHLEHTGSEGIEALAQAGVTPVLLPASVFCLGLGKYPDARQMVERGLPLVVATDFNPGSSPTFSMPFVISLCCTQMGLSPEEALAASTINPAYALGIGNEVGSLESGKSADFSIWPCRDWREIPYHVGSLRPNHVFVKGRQWSGTWHNIGP